jgi:hypothetical protein
MAQFQLGSISHGTLRLKDLIPVFIDTIHRLTTPDMPTVSIDWIGADARLFDDDFFTSDDADQTMVELVEVLNELCPPFVYFGTLEGDGADFGFWPDMPRITEEMRNYPENYDTTSGEVTLTDDNVIVQVSDHGNVTLMDMERNVIWSVV